MGFFSHLFSKKPSPLLSGNASFPAHVDDARIVQMQVAAGGEAVKAVLAQLDSVSFESVSEEPYVIGYFGSLITAHMNAIGLSPDHPELRGPVMSSAAELLLGSKEAAQAFAQNAVTVSPKDKVMRQGAEDAAQDVSMWQRSQGILNHTALMGWRVRRK